MRGWLIAKRKEMNKTQKEVANISKISRSMYAMIEHDERNPSVMVAKNIARALSIDWTLFFE